MIERRDTALPRRGRLLALASLLAASLCCERALALDPRRPLGECLLDVWNQKEGLPHETVKAILQSRDGYLWFGTDGGLVRFDGVKFRVFNHRNTPGLLDDEIETLFEDGDGTLWVGTFGGGLSHHRDGEFVSYTRREGLASNHVTAVLKARDGGIWIGTEAGLNRMQRGSITLYTPREGLAGASVASLYEDAEGVLWIGTFHGGLDRFRDGRLERVELPGLPVASVLSIAGDREGGLWLATGRGLFRRRDGRFDRYTTADGLTSDHLSSVLVDRAGAVWTGSFGGGLCRLVDGRFSSFTARGGLTSDDVYTIAEDRERSLWIGTESGGVNRLRDAQFTFYDRGDGLSSNYLSSVAEDGQGAIWIATNRGLNLLRNGAFTRPASDGELRSENLRTVYPDRSGAVWVGSSEGLFRFRDGAARRFTARDGLAGGPVRVLFEDSRGRLWIGSEEGLSRLEGGRFRSFTTRDGLSSNRIRAICEDRDGSIWIGNRGGGVDRFRDDLFSPLKGPLEGETVTALHCESDGTLWIAVRGKGLGRLQNGSFSRCTTADGLASDYVYAILDDGRGNLWLNSNDGIYRVSKRELEERASGKVRVVASIPYGLESGMIATTSAGGSQPSAWRARDGRLWFATIHGLVVIDPARGRTNLPPPAVRIEGVVADGEKHELGNEPTLRPGSERLEFQYTAFRFLAPDKVRFRYRLDGFDNDWVDAGNRRAAYYTRLPPGSYRFRVTAGNDEGAWSDTGSEFRFRIAPHFYETYWFFGLTGVVLVSGGTGLVRLRLRRLEASERRLEAVVEERTAQLRAEIAERERVEKALRENESLLETAEQVGDIGGWVSWLGSDDPLTWSKQTCRIFGVDPEQRGLKVSTFYSFVHPDDLDKLRATVESAMASGATYSLEHRIVRRDGVVRWVDERAELVRAPDGTPDRWVGVVQDITERKRLEEELRQAHKMEAVGRLAGGIAHDFNNLLTAVLGYTELLLESCPEGSPMRDDLLAIRGSGERAAALTRQLLAFGGKQRLQPAVVSLNAVVESLHPMFCRLIGGSVDLVTRLDPSAGFVQVDPERLEQLILDLAVHARDAMPGGGTITIATRSLEAPDRESEKRSGLPPGPRVELQVGDTGEGMDEETIRRLFEPFFTTRGKGEAGGLGLASAYGFVKQSGGEIRVESEPGRGTTVYVHLPQVIHAQPEPPVAVAASSDTRGTVLLVEDQDDVRALTRKVLERNGYAVLEASDPLDALALSERTPGTIDLMVTDVMMPHLRGTELAARMAELRPGMKVLFLSGFAEEDDLERTVPPGAPFLQKPFTPAALARKVRKILES